MKRLALLAVAALALAAFWWPRLRPVPELDAVGIVLARERAAAHYERGELAAAREELEPLLAQPRPALADLERAAAVEFAAREEGGEPGPIFARLAEADPKNAALHYMRGRESLEQGDFEAALAHFRGVLARVPDDLASRVSVAATLTDLERVDEARTVLAAVVAQGLEHGGGWYVQALYRLTMLTAQHGPADEAARLADLFRQTDQLGYRSATAAELDRGTLAGVAPSPAGGSEGAQPGAPPRFASEVPVLPELAGARELFAHDLDGDGDTDFLACGPSGVQAAFQESGGWRAETVLEGGVLGGDVAHVRALDLGNADQLDLVVVRGGELLLLEHESGAEALFAAAGASRWRPSPLALPSLPGPVSDLALVDFDHEGDLDLLLVGPFGARLLRNDGAAPRTDEQGNVTRGGFVDASDVASLPTAPLAWCLVEDLDSDHDVDLLLGGPGALFVMSSLRAGRFEDVAGFVLARAAGMEREPLCADLDGDARPDLLEPGAPGRFWRQRADGTMSPEKVAPEPLAHAPSTETAPLALDLDLDGTTDVLWASASSAAEVVLGFGLPVASLHALEGQALPGAALVAADLDRDLDLDLARVTPAGLEILRCLGPTGRAARLAPLGLKDNRRAVGAVLEVRTRGLYRRLYWRGEPELVGCGAHETIDVVRITWPNGTVQTRLDVPPAEQPFLDSPAGGFEQSDALPGSCPFLYTWNGTTFTFVTDVLGGTPLGLPIAPGQLVPPDHDEYVHVRGDQLVPRDGRLELQLTEELREVTYLDRLRLDAVDHPRGVEIHPNERFTFPPFPAAHVHTVREPLAPLRATGSDGRDWRAALASVDDVHAEPFAPLEPQFLGLATPHWLELEFEPARLRGATKLRLVCTGWFFWTDASVNMASARTPGVAFVPPTLELPGPDGAWHAVGPPLGFPAGKSKTMVIELDALLPQGLDPERPRLRLSSTLRLYWDSIRLAVDADDAPLVVTSLEPLSATLWPRGFSQPLASERSDLPERFDWDHLAPFKRWNPHPGLYTRHGETLPLVQAIDDRFVILGSGDALHVRFDAGALPPLAEGWERDYLLFLDGWAKDRDPNTVEALNVEPLPFHGMSAYPYGAGERFPDDELHRRWREEWNVRAAEDWIPPLSPVREAQWARQIVGE
jgi:tetratricopeptide (TPR) repeat protein